MKILLVEDEKKTAGFIRKGLSENGLTVDVSERGDDGLKRAMSREYELVILDILLPQRDGWSILEQMRSLGRTTPVLILTALDAVANRVRGLELGADDYLVKPFEFSELLARIRSILRRSQANVPTILQHADLQIDLVRQIATRAGEALPLTPKEFLLLSLLARRSPDTISRQVIGREVWGMEGVMDSNVVDVHVRRLRAKVDDPFEKKLIHTARGAGYFLKDDA